MINSKGYTRIGELVQRLGVTLSELERGSLRLEGLEQSVDEARELYERLVVLRHKAREATLGTGAGKKAPPAEGTGSPAPIRLDTRPPEVSPRQTSLIEAIEETETPATGKEGGSMGTSKAVAPGAGPTLADKLEKAPIPHLGKAIALSQKFWFVAELFNGDRASYEKAIAALDEMKDLKEARRFMADEVMKNVKKSSVDDEAIAAFDHLIERRFK